MGPLARSPRLDEFLGCTGPRRLPAQPRACSTGLPLGDLSGSLEGFPSRRHSPPVRRSPLARPPILSRLPAPAWLIRPPAPAPPPAMSRDWGDNAGRPKRTLEDRHAPSRSSPEGLRREADLRRELSSRDQRRSPPSDSRCSPGRDGRRSPARDGRRSPPRDDRRDRPRSPAPETWRAEQRRSPSPERRRARSPSPGRNPVPPAADAPTRRYQPPQNQPNFPPANGGNGGGGAKA